MWGDTTYKLTQVTTVEDGGLYVFEQGGYVMNNTVSNSSLQTTNTYKTTGLAGNESYVWQLVKKANTTDEFYMKNVKASSKPYLKNSSSTNLAFETNASDANPWKFNFQTDNTVLIQNPNNSDRFLGYSNSTDHLYKAYATSNLSSTPHAIIVYKLVEATPHTITLADDNSTLTEASGGAGVTLPTRSNVGDYTFAGWSETNVVTETTDAPYINAPGTYYPTADVTLYPIYTRTESGSGTTDYTASVTISEYAYANSWGSSSSSNQKSITIDSNVTATCNDGTNSGKYYSDWRIYQNETGKVTISTTSGTLSSVKFDFTVSNTGTLNYNNSEVTSGTAVDVSGTSAEFTVGNSGSATNGQVRITAIEVKYTVGASSTTYYWSSPVAATVARPVITVAENPFLFSTTATITCETEGATIKYSYDGETWNDYSSALSITETKTIYAKAIKDEDESTVASVTATKNLAETTVSVSGDLTLDLDGETNVSAGTLSAAVTYNNAAVDGATVTWSSNNESVATIEASTGAVTIKKTGSVTFTASYAGNSDYAEATGIKTVTVTDSNPPGTETKPYTVSQALEAGTANGVYVQGIISSVTEVSTSYGNATYKISDDGTTSGEMIVYRGKYLNNTNFTNVNQIKVGDHVVVYGPLSEHNSANQLSSGNYLVSLVRDFTLTLDAMTNGSATVQVNGVEQTPNADGEVTVASDATVTLTATPNSGYTFGKWTCTTDDWNNNTDNPLVFTMPFEDVMFGATFVDASAEYEIIVDDAVVGGTIEADKTKAKKDVEVTLTAHPSANYAFSAWDVRDEDDNAVTVNNNKFSMPASDVTVTATFLPVYTVTYYIGGEEHSTTRVSGEALNLDSPSGAFEGWSSANSTTSPVFVANDAKVTGNMTLYAVFVSGYSDPTYNLVEANQSDWRGDYLIAYSSTVFADGRVGGTGTNAIGAANQSVNPGNNLSGKVVDASWGDTYNVTLVAIDDSELSNGYLLKTKDGKYNYRSSNTNGLDATETKSTAANYPITVTFNSSSDVELGLASGAVFHYNTDGYFRFYKDGGQSAVYLYKKTINKTYSLDVYEEVTIGESGYASYCSPNALDFTDSEVKAYKASVDNTTGKVKLTKVDVVPAEEGVVLHCATPDTYNIPVTTEAVSDVTGNEMVGVLTRTQVLWESGDKHNYILQQGKFNMATDGYLKANRAYLSTEYDVTTAGTRSMEIFFDEGETTGIADNNRETITNNGSFFDLQGRKVANPTKGLYIVNGKKMVVK